MKRFVIFDVVDNDKTPSLEDLCGQQLELGDDNYHPNQPKFLGWEDKALAWAKAHVGDNEYYVDPIGPHDTFVSLSYDDDTVYIPSSLDDNMDF